MQANQLRSIAPALPPALANAYAPLIDAAMKRFNIATPAEQACFLGQLLHESQGLRVMQENLNYRPQALMATFRGRFTPEQAGRFGFVPGRQQADVISIANIAYAGKNGNGDVNSGDGYRYRGRGPIELTGLDNYRRCGVALGVDLVKNPDLVAQPEYGFLAAAWFWAEGNKTGKSLNALANAGKVAAITEVVNGPAMLGLQERMDLTNDALKALA
jgi:putative chitinase